MRYNDHSELVGSHAFLSASNNHWLNYEPEKLATVFRSRAMAQRGTDLHAWAHEAVRLKQKQSSSKKTLNMYINDCIGFRMDNEVILFYSYYAFGTCDAILWRNNKLKIFDLKTGVTKASMNQLLVYVALFCLEYEIKPHTIEEIELRIYKDDEIETLFPELEDIVRIMDKITTSTRIIEEINEKEMS